MVHCSMHTITHNGTWFYYCSMHTITHTAGAWWLQRYRYKIAYKTVHGCSMHTITHIPLLVQDCSLPHIWLYAGIKLHTNQRYMVAACTQSHTLVHDCSMHAPVHGCSMHTITRTSTWLQHAHNHTHTGTWLQHACTSTWLQHAHNYTHQYMVAACTQSHTLLEHDCSMHTYVPVHDYNMHVYICTGTLARSRLQYAHTHVYVYEHGCIRAWLHTSMVAAWRMHKLQQTCTWLQHAHMCTDWYMIASYYHEHIQGSTDYKPPKP